MAKLTDEEFIKIQEENSELFRKHYEKIKKLPDDTFIGLPLNKTVNVPINGMFFQYLRIQMDYLMQAEEPYTVVESLLKIKDKMSMHTTRKTEKKALKEGIKTKYDNFDIAFYCCYALIAQISAIAESSGNAIPFDRDEVFKSVDKKFMQDAPVPDIDPLSAEELAKRMGITVGKDGKVKFDEDYIKKRGLDKEKSTNADIESHFGAPAEDVMEMGVNPAKPYDKRKENRREKWDNS